MSELDTTQQIASLSPETRMKLFEQLQARKKSQALPKHRIVRQNRESMSFPASSAQQRVWFLDRLLPDKGVYNVPAMLSLRGRLNLVALEQSLNEIVRRHEALRTTFVDVDGQPVQWINPFSPRPLPVIDLTTLADPEQREATIQHHIQEETHKPFDLASDLLLRISLLHLAEGEAILLLTIHHIACDGWSVGVFLQELSTLYTAFSQGVPSPLSELAIQYVDYTHWQRERLQNGALQEHLTYWTRQLQDAPTALDLPTDRPRPALQSFHGVWYPFTLPDQLSREVRTLSRQENVSLFMSLLTAFAILLACYSGQDDLAICTPIANRTYPELESLIGFFVNLLILRTDLAGNPTLQQLLARVRSLTLDAYAHQDLPFDTLIEALHPTRDLRSMPFFQAAFALQNAPLEALTLGDLHVQFLEYDPGSSKADLTLYLWEQGESLLGSIEYNTDLFDEATIQRMLTHYQQILRQLVACPERRLSELELLTPAEMEQILVHWNASPQATDAPDTPACMHERFEEQVQRTPDALALILDQQQITYTELNQQTNRLAHYLRAQGVGPGVLVGISLERSLEMIVAVLAVLKAGGAYVPLDPGYPVERLAWITEDAHLQLVLTQQRLAERFTVSSCQVVCLDSAWTQISQQFATATTTPESGVCCLDLAYIIYTSGSTGQPKGVLIPHQAIDNTLKAARIDLDLGPGKLLPQLNSLSFDASILEIFPTLCSGATLLLLPPQMLAVGETLAALLRQFAATHLFIIPSQLESLPREEFAHLSTIVVGAERCLAQTVMCWAPGRRFYNIYGPTEISIYATKHSCSPLSEQAPAIGKPIPKMEAYILDQQMRPVPIGVAGELYLGGRGLAWGYLHRPELTAERFVPDPFSGRAGSRLYRTGDLTRFLSDGSIEFLGRADQQIKIRGHRIELGEIETALLDSSAIKECALLARENANGEKQVVAYVVPGSTEQGTPEVAAATLLSTEQVDQWQQLFDETYHEGSSSYDPTFNIAGWNSSYDDQPIPAEEMRVWVDSTVERILSLRPRRVLEIGCGSGLLLFPLAPYCEFYCGTDFSLAAVKHLERLIHEPERNLSHVALQTRTADDFSAIEEGSFDTVIINSVVQYFPNIDYLVEVLKGAVRVVGSKGKIFIGDVRNLQLLEAFHTSVEVYRSPVSLSIDQLQQSIQKRLAQENELAVDPAFFRALQCELPQISALEICPKRGRFQNELTRFRYDVVLSVGTPVSAQQDLDWLDWQKEEFTLASLRQLLEEQKPELLVLEHVPNARLAAVTQAQKILTRRFRRPETVAELRQELSTLSDAEAMEPEDLWQLSADCPYDVAMSWLNTLPDGSYRVILQRRAPGEAGRTINTLSLFSPPNNGGQPWSVYGNNPLKEKSQARLGVQLRDFLKQRLPDYMVPASIVVLDTLPLLASGKVNYRELPDPGQLRLRPEIKHQPPRTTLERTIATIWQELLQVEKPGITENFFDLGGHSLLLVQVHSRLQAVLKAEIAIVDMFKYPTIGSLAEFLSQPRETAQTFQADQERAMQRRASMQQQKQFRQRNRQATS